MQQRPLPDGAAQAPITPPRRDELILDIWAGWEDMAEDVLAGLIFAGFAVTVLYVGSLMQLIGAFQ